MMNEREQWTVEAQMAHRPNLMVLHPRTGRVMPAAEFVHEMKTKGLPMPPYPERPAEQAPQPDQAAQHVGELAVAETAAAN